MRWGGAYLSLLAKVFARQPDCSDGLLRKLLRMMLATHVQSEAFFYPQAKPVLCHFRRAGASWEGWSDHAARVCQKPSDKVSRTGVHL